MPKFFAKSITWDRSVLANICDEELLGATLREKDLTVTLKPEYFGERLVDEHEVRALLEKGDILDLVGKKVVGLALEAKMAHPGAVRVIQSVPMLMIYKFSASAKRM